MKLKPREVMLTEEQQIDIFNSVEEYPEDQRGMFEMFLTAKWVREKASEVAIWGYEEHGRGAVVVNWVGGGDECGVTFVYITPPPPVSAVNRRLEKLMNRYDPAHELVLVGKFGRDFKSEVVDLIKRLSSSNACGPAKSIDYAPLPKVLLKKAHSVKEVER